MFTGSESESELLSEKYDSLGRGFDIRVGEKLRWVGVSVVGREGTKDWFGVGQDGVRRGQCSGVLRG